mmetsp:Transcript_34535/g.33732  ORF Transcript_34535/g.33732 Transcript_34535/m.33732 type:complete len:123 (+) Transcript_34535:370-738(+)
MNSATEIGLKESYKDSIYNCLGLSYFVSTDNRVPFITAKSQFKQAILKANTLLQEIIDNEYVDNEELSIVSVYLIYDLVYQEQKLSQEDLKALVSKYDLLLESDIKTLIDSMTDKIWEKSQE